MNVSMMRVARGRKDRPWLPGMDDLMPPGTPVWYMEEPYGKGIHRRVLPVYSYPSPEQPTRDYMAARGWYVPHGAVVPMER
jgi:hypothetical protein